MRGGLALSSSLCHELTVKFLPFLKDAKYIKSMFTIRTLLSNKEKTDERTSNIKQISDKLYVVLTGKWNTTVKIAKNIEQNLLK